jgi:recombinational DNA repair ATPase RecF
MIESISIESFRCLKDVELTLTPLTVLLGPNASGKSSMLSVLDPTRTVVQTDFWPGADRVEVRVRHADGRTVAGGVGTAGGDSLGMTCDTNGGERVHPPLPC